MISSSVLMSRWWCSDVSWPPCLQCGLGMTASLDFVCGRRHIPAVPTEWRSAKWAQQQRLWYGPRDFPTLKIMFTRHEGWYDRDRRRSVISTAAAFLILPNPLPCARASDANCLQQITWLPLGCTSSCLQLSLRRMWRTSCWCRPKRLHSWPNILLIIAQLV